MEEEDGNIENYSISQTLPSSEAEMDGYLKHNKKERAKKDELSPKTTWNKIIALPTQTHAHPNPSLEVEGGTERSIFCAIHF